LHDNQTQLQADSAAAQETIATKDYELQSAQSQTQAVMGCMDISLMLLEILDFVVY
jgi:Tfp pilus assembly protein FimV